MRSYQVFAAMSQEDATRFMKTLADEVPTMFNQALMAASAAMKARPVYLKRQPFEKRAAAVRRALSRVSANPVADEVLAVYFLDCKKALLTEWLDLLGLEHEDGTLKDETPVAPPDGKLTESIEKYLGADDDADRGLLLRAFAAQEAVEWPTLDASFAGGA
jgi:hypothetical protein